MSIVGSVLGGIGGALLTIPSGGTVNPMTGAAIGSTLGNAISGGGSEPQVMTTQNTRTSTPYQVKMPSGAIVTMYAHGPDQQTVTKTGGGMDDGTALSSALNTFGVLGEKKPAASAVPPLGSNTALFPTSNPLGLGGGAPAMTLATPLTDEWMKSLGIS